MMVTSCQDEDSEVLNANENPMNVKIEYTTKEKINEVFIANGLEPFPDKVPSSLIKQLRVEGREDVIDYLQRETPLKCSLGVAAWLGDWSGNAVFTSFDLVLAQQFLNANQTCSGGICGYTTTSGGGNPWEYGQFSSWYFAGTERFTLNDYDIWISRQVLLGLLPCT